MGLVAGCLDGAPALPGNDAGLIPRDATLADGSGPPAGPLLAVSPACSRRFCPTSLPTHGSTVAVGDIDGDDRLDVLLGDSGPMLGDLGPVVLLRNTGPGGFVDVTSWAGLAGVGAWSAIFGDLDGDGDQDLVIGGREVAPRGTREEGDERVYLNDGRGRFTPRPLPGHSVARQGVPLTLDLADLDGDGALDIISGRSGTDARGQYLPRILLGRPGLAFVDRSTVVNDDGFAWIALATDFTDDGRPDLLISHDGHATYQVPLVDPATGPCELRDLPGFGQWLNAAYRNEARPGDLRMAIADLGGNYASQDFSPMGIAVGDFDEDRRLDYIMTTVNNPELFLGSATGVPVFTQRHEGLRLPMPDGPKSSGWSALARDIDEDGRVDVLMTWGVIPVGPRDIDNTIYLNRGGLVFEAMPPGSGFDLPGASWSALATGDFDGDGDDDLVVGAQTLYLRPCDRPAAHALLLLNQGGPRENHGLRVRLRGTVSNPDGLGARIEAEVGGRTLVREVSQGGATMATSSPVVHLGIGAATVVPLLRVRWPDGLVQELRDVAAGRTLEVLEPRWFSIDFATRPVREAVTVRVEVASADGVSLTLQGDARWLSEMTRGAGGALERRFTGTGDVAVEVASAPQGLHAIRRVRFQ